MARLHREWTKNDGKRVEDWAPSSDLKETVLKVGLVICTALMAVFAVMQMVG